MVLSLVKSYFFKVWCLASRCVSCIDKQYLYTVKHNLYYSKQDLFTLVKVVSDGVQVLFVLFLHLESPSFYISSIFPCLE
jgi:hypothetical protein